MTRKINIACDVSLNHDEVGTFNGAQKVGQLNINIVGNIQTALSALAKFDGSSLYVIEHTDMVMYALNGSLSELYTQLENSSVDSCIFDYCKIFGPSIEIVQIIDKLYESLSLRDDFVISYCIDSSMNDFTVALMGCKF